MKKNNIVYWLLIPVAVIIISTVDALFFSDRFDLTWYMFFVWTAIDAIAVFCIDGLFAFIIRRLPERWFAIGTKLVRVHKFENKLYMKLGVKKWRDHIPELGGFTDFHKDHVYKPNDNEYVARYILEANYGTIIHIAGIIFGFSVIFIPNVKYALAIGLPVAIVNAVYNELSVMILRFNLPKLYTLYKRNERRAEELRSTLTKD